MIHYSIDHDTEAFKAYAIHQGIDLDQPGIVLSKLHFLVDVTVEQMGRKQAWILTDDAGNKWLQSYHTVVSVKWADTGDVEHFGKWSMTTSRHQGLFSRVA